MTDHSTCWAGPDLMGYRCEDGRLMRHDPQHDDPYLETDVGECPECEGEGCDPEIRIASLTRQRDEARAEAEMLREALLDATAHLAGAASAYRTYAKRHPSRGEAETDALFSTRANDFDNAVSRARAALSALDTEEGA